MAARLGHGAGRGADRNGAHPTLNKAAVGSAVFTPSERWLPLPFLFLR